MNLSTAKKWVLGVIMLAILTSNFINIPGASATDGGGAYFHAGLYLNKEYILDTLSRATARALYQIVISRITEKIKGGGPDGGPAFVQNWRNFQTNAQYRGEDVFRTILAHTNVCNYLSNDLKKAFRVAEIFKIVELKEQNIRTGDMDPFTLRSKCNLPEGFNLIKYGSDFAGNGGWEAFSRLNQSQGNMFGLFLESLDELDRQRELEVAGAVNEVVSGGGYTALRNACEKIAGQPRCVFLKNVKTPADLVAKGAGLILDKNLEWLTNADELSEMLVGLLSSIFGYFEDLSEAPDFNSTTTNTAAATEQEKLEYCTSRKPVQEVIDKYKGLFDPYGFTRIGFGPCGDPTDKDNQNDPYPFQACVKQCLDKVGYLPTPIPLPSLPSSLPEPTEGQCTGFGSSTCPGQGGTSYPNCGKSASATFAYALRVHHLDMYDAGGGVRYLWNIGTNGDPNSPSTWAEWYEAPPANNAEAWCTEAGTEAWKQEHTISAPITTPPPHQGIRCINGTVGVCASSGGNNNGGGAGGGVCWGDPACTLGQGALANLVVSAVDRVVGQNNSSLFTGTSCGSGRFTIRSGQEAAFLGAVVATLPSGSTHDSTESVQVVQGGVGETYDIIRSDNCPWYGNSANVCSCNPPHRDGGSGGGGGGGGGRQQPCDNGATLNDNPNIGTMNNAMVSAVNSACSQYCNGGGSQPAISNLTAYINAVVSHLNNNGYIARYHSSYGDAKNITVKKSGGSFSEDFAIWAGEDTAPRALREAFAFRCTPASAY